jgi:hypothetical protein
MPHRHHDGVHHDKEGDGVLEVSVVHQVEK